MSIPILYQDAQIIVCIKPFGMQSEHAQKVNVQSANEQCSKTKNAVIPSLPDMLFEQETLKSSLFVVHRLDTVASGVMVFAKTKQAAANLSEQIANNTMQKTYRSIASGFFEEKQGSMVDFLYHDKRKGRVYPVKKERKGVKKAILDYKVVCEKTIEVSQNMAVLQKSKEQSTDNAPNAKQLPKACNAEMLEVSLLEILLKTGRTHQIRAQCAARKHPLLGDGKYGSRVKLSCTTLWSYKLEFKHPKTGEFLNFCEDMPSEYPWSFFQG